MAVFAWIKGIKFINPLPITYVFIERPSFGGGLAFAWVRKGVKVYGTK